MQREVFISGEMIRLGQLLKLAGIAGDGVGAAEMIRAGQVVVNGEPETRRGRQLRAGDSVTTSAEELVVRSDIGRRTSS